MGSLGDGGGWPSDGGVPDLPPEWGDIVIPDDISSLADEAAAVRAELRRDRRQHTWHRFLDRPAARGLRRVLSAGLRLPVLVITIAAVVTVASLFASAWHGPTRAPSTQRTSGTPTDSHDTLPALELSGDGGEVVPLLQRLPAVILLIDGCTCATLVRDTAAAVRAPVNVVTVRHGTGPSDRRPGPNPAGQEPAAGPPEAAGPRSPGAGGTTTTPGTAPAPTVAGPAIRPAPATVHHLWDPSDGLRLYFHLGTPDTTAAALLVDRTGRVVRTVQRTFSVEDLRPDLDRLAA